WFLIATFLGPVVLGALMIVPAWLSMRSVPSADVANITILDATGTDLGKRVAAKLAGPLGDSATARVQPVAPSALAAAESSATADAIAKRTRGYLVLDSLTLSGI